MMALFRERFAGARVAPVEEAGWRGDAMEAECFAWLAFRRERGLPLSVPETTGVREPVTGGDVYRASPPRRH